jgi:hypothetical protein
LGLHTQCVIPLATGHAIRFKKRRNKMELQPLRYTRLTFGPGIHVWPSGRYTCLPFGPGILVLRFAFGHITPLFCFEKAEKQVGAPLRLPCLAFGHLSVGSAIFSVGRGIFNKAKELLVCCCVQDPKRDTLGQYVQQGHRTKPPLHH